MNKIMHFLIICCLTNFIYGKVEVLNFKNQKIQIIKSCSDFMNSSFILEAKEFAKKNPCTNNCPDSIRIPNEIANKFSCEQIKHEKVIYKTVFPEDTIIIYEKNKKDNKNDISFIVSSNDITINNIKLKAHTGIRFSKDGFLQFGILSEDTLINNYFLKRETPISFFYNSSKVEYGYSAFDLTILDGKLTIKELDRIAFNKDGSVNLTKISGFEQKLYDAFDKIDKE